MKSAAKEAPAHKVQTHTLTLVLCGNAAGNIGEKLNQNLVDQTFGTIQ